MRKKEDDATPVRERRLWEKKRRQERLADIAGRIFSGDDYNAVTMDQVAQRAGYCKRTLYLYFKDKEDLFAAVVVRHLQSLQARLADAAAQGGTGLEQIRRIALTYFRFCLDEPVAFRLIMIFDHLDRYYRRVVDDPQEGRFKAQCQSLADANADFAIRAIAGAVQDGSIRTTLTPLQLMFLLWGQLSGVLDLILSRQDILKSAYDISPEALFNHYLRMAEAGLNASPPPTAGSSR